MYNFSVVVVSKCCSQSSFPRSFRLRVWRLPSKGGWSWIGGTEGSPRSLFPDALQRMHIALLRPVWARASLLGNLSSGQRFILVGPQEVLMSVGLFYNGCLEAFGGLGLFCSPGMQIQILGTSVTVPSSLPFFFPLSLTHSSSTHSFN